MKKIKKLSLLFTVGLVLFMPVIGLIPPLTQVVQAENNASSGSWWGDATVEERVEMYLLTQAAAKCIEQNEGDAVSLGDLEEEKSYFAGHSDTTAIGVYMSQVFAREGEDKKNGGDGKLNCDGDAEEWMARYFDIVGNSGVISKVTGVENSDNDVLSTACFLGYWPNTVDSIWNVSDGSYAINRDQFQMCIDDSGDGLHVNRDADRFKKGFSDAMSGFAAADIYGNLMGDAERYFFWLKTFSAACVTSEGGGDLGKYSELSPTEAASADFKINIINSEGVVEEHGYSAENPASKEVIVGMRSNLDEWKLKCDTLAESVNKYADGAAAYFKSNPDQAAGIANGTNGTGTDGSFDTTGTEIDNKCADISITSFFSLEWAICPLIGGMMDLANTVEKWIAGMLCIDTNQIFGAGGGVCSTSGSSTSDAFYAAWSTFRILALGLIAIAALFMIISQALGFEIVDAYTVKKTLPRILIAAVGISLSWPLLEFLVTLSNALGVGVRNLIYAPFTLNGIDEVGVLSGGATFVTGIFATGAAVALGALGLLSFVATAALAILIAFFVLIVRNILVIFLILTAPICIAAYVLPNTEKYWKLWWEWLFKALMAFPIITGMIAVGHVFAAITYEAGGGFLETFVAYAAYFIPYFLIPAAFRFAGGALATIGGFANDRSRGGFDRLSGFRKNQSVKNWQATQENRRFNPRANGVIGKVNRGLNNALGSAADPVSSAKIYGGGALRKAGFDNSIGKGVIGQIDDSKFASTQKATELLMSKQFNDQALRSLMGLEHATPQNIRAEAARLSASDDVNARIAGNQLTASATSLSTALSSDPEMGRANLQAAAGLALAQHGFADPDDIATLGNQLGGTENGFASMVVGQAQMNSARAGRSDFKPGYSVRLGPGNQFEGTTDLNTRNGDIGNKTSQVTKTQQEQLGRSRAAMVQRLKGLGTYEMQQAKPQTIKGLAMGYETMLSSAPGKYEFINDTGGTSTYEFSAADQKRVLDQFANMKSGHSGANADQISEIDKILVNSGRMADVEALITRQELQTGDPEQDGRIPKPH